MVEVTQADREAVSISYHYDYAVQSYAAHRIQSTADLQAKLDKATEALQEMLSRRQYPIGSYWRNGAQFTSEYGNEYESTSDILAGCKEDVRYLETALNEIRGETEDE